MSTQEIALRNDNQVALRRDTSELSEVQRLGGLLAASGYFSDAREMAQAAVKVLAGRELGIPPVAAMMGINIIKGKVAMGGNLIASRIRAHGYDFRHKQFDAKGCVLEFLSRPDASGKRTVMGEASFTEEDAKAAGLVSDMYRKFPRNMYFNRAVSNGAKWYTPEVFAGAPVYVPEELGAKVDENGDMIHDEPTQAQVAERKIAELKARKPVEVPATEPAQDEAAAQIKARLDQFAKIRAAIGDEAYYRILQFHGHEHANEIKSLNKAREIYRDMQAEHKTQQQRATEFDQRPVEAEFVEGA